MTQTLHLQRACRTLRDGGVVAYPTEAVWGLGCDPENVPAVLHLLALKRRPMSKGLILLGADFDQVAPYLARPFSEDLEPVRRSWPGPVTWVLPASRVVPPWLNGGRDTVAVRVTAHPVANALCAHFGGPIISTSANVSRRPAARTRLQVMRRFGNKLLDVLPGDVGSLERPTPIRELRSGKLLRS